MKMQRLGAVVMLAAGIYSVIRAFRAKELFLSGIGGNRATKPLPNWVGRPLMFIFGIAAMVLGFGLWFQK
jgi:hypothetical protein